MNHETYKCPNNMRPEEITSSLRHRMKIQSHFEKQPKDPKSTRENSVFEYKHLILGKGN